MYVCRVCSAGLPPPTLWFLSQQEQLWAACAGYDDIYIWSLKDLAASPERVPLQDCSEINCMIRVKKQVRRGCAPSKSTLPGPALAWPCPLEPQLPWACRQRPCLGRMWIWGAPFHPVC